MQIKKIIQFLESIAPPMYQESYDNVGLLVGNPEWNLKGALICLDSTEAVIEEAIERNCNLVIAHHPIVFRGLKRFNGTTYVERTVMKAIKADVAIYAIHTNLDNVYQNGVNAKIAQQLGLAQTKILAPKNREDLTVGSGMIGILQTSMDEISFLEYLKEQMHVTCVKHTALLGRKVNRVAVCGGSGGFLLNHAIRQQADFFITSDYKYHEFFDADRQIVIADIGHYESEQFTINLLHGLLTEKFRNFAPQITNINTNPVSYFY